ncbi:tyrosine kinase:aminoglycoside phosphotransferase [Micractinium conductrix]|uniref:Tyrosine kinase:aminoglycoside phosphotransferase n=1 Tax=Micractinium conductrix TaxID=554055 RepID=A0A2P6V2F0_9CHLO|nr:tyrosine kinase:aminoglycoside phosphotransferase [Micractinium conductrix]|eukprot:PSC68262.1 tyrosine kinase:aminoglycoside phosphotransferase [Micractinium conductrix]
MAMTGSFCAWCPPAGEGMPRRLRNARLAPALVAGVAAAQLGLVPAHVHALEMAAQQEPAMGTVASELAAPAASALQHLNLPSMLQDKLELALAFDSFPAALLSSLEVQPSELQQPAATQAGYKFRHMNQHGFCYSRVLCGPRGGAAGAAVDGA